MRRSVLAFLAILAITVAAQEPAPQSPAKGDDPELEALLGVLEQETELATKTRLNSDYVPGIVTVLEGSQLEAMGIANAWEALGLVPGIQPWLDPRGAPSVIGRGIDFPFNSGNIQILLNSVPIVRADAGFNNAALLIPVEQIDRIEVIRGPGSVVYGDFAFMGLVNIITRRESGARVWGRHSTRLNTGGARFTSRDDRHAFSLDIAHGSSDDAPMPRLRNNDEQRTFAVAALEVGDLTFTLQSVTRDLDTRASGPATAGLRVDEETIVGEARYAKTFRGVRSTFRASQLRSDLASGTTVVVGAVTRISADFVARPRRGHSLLIGTDYSISTIDRASQVVQGNTIAVAVGASRRIRGITAQDTFDMTPRVSLTLGARYDAYSDLDSRVTPRGSLVWRITDSHIVKGQFSEGFRPPTFFELYARVPAGVVPRYPFEVNATSEINYIFKNAGRVARATLFRSTIRDMVRPGGVVTPGKAVAEGVELEWTQQVAPNLKLEANATWSDTTDPRAGNQRSRAAASWLGNLVALYRPFRSTTVSARTNHGLDRLFAEDTHTLDLTISQERLGNMDLGIRGGVKNALDEDVNYVFNAATGPQVLPSHGRTVWAQLSWRF